MIRSVHAELPLGIVQTIIGQPLDIVAGILSEMDIFIGNDSGIGHLAASVKVPTVSIFGPSGPVHWRPAGTKSVVVHKPQRKSDPRPASSLNDVKQGIFLSIQQHIDRECFPILDQIRLSKVIRWERTKNATIVRSGQRGPACAVTSGWRRVKQILTCLHKSGSYNATLQKFPDSGPLLDLFILHGIVLQGRP